MEFCDKIVFIENGRVSSVGSLEYVRGKNSEFFREFKENKDTI